MKNTICALLLMAVSSAAPAHARLAEKDAEALAHDDASARYELIETYRHPGFEILQFKLGVLSHYSYLLVSGGKALVVDPGRDVDAHLEAARAAEAEIAGVFLTHSHADFVAGHLELAARANCPVYANKESGAGYPFQPLSDGSEIRVGAARVQAVTTPGHTPDGMCGYVFGPESGAQPEAIFTGDTLFVGSVGRPDLLEGTMSAAALASMLYDSWTQKLSKAGDAARVLPAHGAGSLCGAHLSDDPSSTIGAEKQSNPYLRHAFRSDFIAAVLEGLPEAPRYFAHNARLNRTGPPLVEWDAPLPPETPPGPALADPSEFFVVDLRDAADHARAHIPNSLNIALRGRFETWTGTMVPWETMEKGRLILCGSRGELAEALRRLHRVGYRAGIVTMESWKAAGLPVAASALISPAELHAAMRAGTAPIVVDVRLPNEWMASRIGNVINLPLTHLAELSAKLDPSQPVVAVCNSAYRSSMAAGVLARNGFTKVSSMTGGSEAWVEAGLPTIGAERAGGGAAPGPVRAVRLPERISPLDLHRMIADLPGTFELVDIRPVAQFSDYHLPGSKNVDIADLIADPAFLAGTVPLVVVDRDGTLAMAAGGILSQKTKRPIKVLHGGLSRYWDDSMAGSWNAAPGAAPPPAASPAGVPTPAPKTKKRSAGC